MQSGMARSRSPDHSALDALVAAALLRAGTDASAHEIARDTDVSLMRTAYALKRLVERGLAIAHAHRVAAGVIVRRYAPTQAAAPTSEWPAWLAPRPMLGTFVARRVVRMQD